MKRLSLRLIISLTTFFVGITAVGFWVFYNYVPKLPKQETVSVGSGPVFQTNCTLTESEATEKFTKYIENSEMHFIEYLANKPYSVSRGNRHFEDGWTAFFLQKRSYKYYKRNAGKLFYMDSCGKDIFDEHQDVILSPPKKN